MLECTAEAVRVSRGLVLWVVAGVTRKHCYQPGPEGLLYEWWKAGGQCWRPAFWYRVGIPGSGGKQWLRADVEYVLAFKGEQGPIPWSDNTAFGHKPKWAPGGEMSHRSSDGHRVNQWGHSFDSGANSGRGSNGVLKIGGVRPSHKMGRITRGSKNGDTIQSDSYLPPALANPGTLIKVPVGGGLLGDKRAHENEAPFPERLVEKFILGWCPPGGTVLDCYSGSGTTVAVAKRFGRIGVGLDIRASQCDLGLARTSTTAAELFQ